MERQEAKPVNLCLSQHWECPSSKILPQSICLYVLWPGVHRKGSNVCISLISRPQTPPSYPTKYYVVESKFPEEKLVKTVALVTHEWEHKWLHTAYLAGHRRRATQVSYISRYCLTAEPSAVHKRQDPRSSDSTREKLPAQPSHAVPASTAEERECKAIVAERQFLHSI